MVQSAAKTVDEFLSDIEPERASALRQIRKLCQDHLPGWEERMQWGMPGYGPEGADAVVSFNNQKGYIAFYPGRDALDPCRGRVKGATFGGGCIRFAKPSSVDLDAISTMLQHVYKNGRSKPVRSA